MKTLSILFARIIIRKWTFAVLINFCGFLLVFLFFKKTVWDGIGDDWHEILMTGFTLFVILPIVFLSLCIPTALVIHSIGWRLCRKTIVRYGERAHAIMETVSEVTNPLIRAENDRTFRYVFSFVDASGQRHTKFFLKSGDSPTAVEEDGVPTYPKEKFVRYPKLGEKFEVLYLKGLEKHPIILNTGNSEFVRHIQEEHRQNIIRQLSDRVSKAKILADADPYNPERQRLYQQAQQDLYNYQQFGTEPMLVESFSRGLVFKSNP
ncbi:hypothetical protein V9W64_05725 [Neisseria leonii]|uniref:Uncharacterized protein n=1 Tax=Neisseria leonii TaxID=2995413 RepID=A0A9X4IB98_9NEIS|nr:hypothetical protein [Neisseria sp. 51.81]MDD9328195.1 hypothetical protein [Neisseria sp. 51.81]